MIVEIMKDGDKSKNTLRSRHITITCISVIMHEYATHDIFRSQLCIE